MILNLHDKQDMEKGNKEIIQEKKTTREDDRLPLLAKGFCHMQVVRLIIKILLT